MLIIVIYNFTKWLNPIFLVLYFDDCIIVLLCYLRNAMKLKPSIIYINIGSTHILVTGHSYLYYVVRGRTWLRIFRKLIRAQKSIIAVAVTRHELRGKGGGASSNGFPLRCLPTKENPLPKSRVTHARRPLFWQGPIVARRLKPIDPIMWLLVLYRDLRLPESPNEPSHKCVSLKLSAPLAFSAHLFSPLLRLLSSVNMQV